VSFIERFRASLKIPTWWPPEALQGDASAAAAEAEAALMRFQEFLVENYPVFHKAAERWVLNHYSVLYRWPGAGGTGKDGDNSAVLLLSHYDVVPAETEKWSVDPYGAEMKDGFIYGRGSLDMKSTLISIMEAAESLCAAGFRPKRDVWFAFGGDEERTGHLGAREASRWFAQRGLRFSWLLDEGAVITDNQIKGIDSPLALVSIEEKGFLSLDLSVEQEPGHSSRPPKTQAAAILGRALYRIAGKQFPFKLVPTVETFFKQVSPLMPGIRGFIMRHARAFGLLFFKLAADNPVTAAMLRTTIAMTQLEGSAADNVLPSKVHAVVNLRLLQPWTVETATDFIKKAIHDKRVQINIYGSPSNPVPASRSYQHSGWPEMKTALAEAWPGVPLMPFIMVSATDSRHYKEITDSIFRFSPHKLDPKEWGGVHGHDERISEENLYKGLTFFSKLLESL
jgi:carboxypeptidase PM20D1